VVDEQTLANRGTRVNLDPSQQTTKLRYQTRKEWQFTIPKNMRYSMKYHRPYAGIQNKFKLTPYGRIVLMDVLCSQPNIAKN
jgi:hypothetical protein